MGVSGDVKRGDWEWGLCTELEHVQSMGRTCSHVHTCRQSCVHGGTAAPAPHRRNRSCRDAQVHTSLAPPAPKSLTPGVPKLCGSQRDGRQGGGWEAERREGGRRRVGGRVEDGASNDGQERRLTRPAARRTHHCGCAASGLLPLSTPSQSTRALGSGNSRKGSPGRGVLPWSRPPKSASHTSS